MPLSPDATPTVIRTATLGADGRLHARAERSRGRRALQGLGLLAMPWLAIALEDGAARLPTTLIAFATLMSASEAFSILRRYPDPSPLARYATLALLFSLLLPPAIPWWQVVLATGFGIVFGELIFGGPGYAFLQPVAVGVAFQHFSFGSETLVAFEGGIAALAWITIVALAALRLVPLSTLIAIALGLAVGALFTGDSPGTDSWIGQLGRFADALPLLALAWLGADMSSGAATADARLVHGALVGLLASLFSASGPALVAVVFACLLGQIACPTIEHASLSMHVARLRRRARHV